MCLDCFVSLFLCKHQGWCGWKKMSLNFSNNISSMTSCAHMCMHKSQHLHPYFYVKGAMLFGVCIYKACVGDRCTRECVDWRFALLNLTQTWTFCCPCDPYVSFTHCPPSCLALMQGGVKHLVMLNHSRAPHARSHPEWQRRTREPGRLRGEMPHRPQGKEEKEVEEEGWEGRGGVRRCS